MSSTPALNYLLLDKKNDPVFEPGAQLSGSAAVSQAILTRLRLFLGEWWEDLTLGLPVFQSILGQLGSAQGIAAMSLAIQRQIEGVPYVTAVTSIKTSFTNGKLLFSATAQTQFGTVSVSNLPAVVDSLEV